MEYLLKDREPKEALRYFEEISAIPRGSGNEEAISQYLLERLYHKARLCRL